MLDQIEKIEGLLNTFGTLVTDMHPGHVPTLHAVYRELAVLKGMVNAPTDESPAADILIGAVDVEDEY